MVRYIIRRLLWVIVLLLAVSFVTFVIFYTLPSADPAALRAGRQPNPDLVKTIRHQLGLDRPWPVQYWLYMKKIVLHFDFGYSYQNSAPVRQQIFDRLPATSSLTAFSARLLRANLLETMSEDYIRTARAKGLSERRVILGHGVRAAITPIVTVLGLDVGILLGGAILTESVFNIPGVGRLAYDAIQHSDLPVIQGTVLFGAFFIVIANLVVDIAYAFIDPRVRYR